MGIFVTACSMLMSPASNRPLLAECRKLSVYSRGVHGLHIHYISLLLRMKLPLSPILITTKKKNTAIITSYSRSTAVGTHDVSTLKLKAPKVATYYAMPNTVIQAAEYNLTIMCKCT